MARSSRVIGQVPCACGCGGMANLRAGQPSDNRFIHGHFSKINPPSRRPNAKHRQPKRVYVNGVEGKVCPHCNEWKSIDEFLLIHKQGKLLRDSWCKKCKSDVAKARNKINPRKRKPLLLLEKREIVLSDRDIERFWSKVDIRGEDECWLWKAGTFGGRYGAFSIKGYQYRAHRVAWVIANGRQIQGGMIIAHAPIICHNTLCCNPKHVREATDADNMEDRDVDGTTSRGDQHWTRIYPEKVIRGEQHPRHLHPELWAVGENVHNARWTNDQIREIRSMYESGNYTQVQIAKIFETTQSRISEIVRRERWKHVKESEGVYAVGGKWD